MIKILAIEDDIAIAHVYKLIFSGKNASFDIAVDGMTAMHKLNLNSYDLIISDLNMGEISGYEIIEHIKQSQLNKQAKILVCSGVEDEYEQQKVLECGATEYLLKPFNPRNLVEIINTWFNEDI